MVSSIGRGMRTHAEIGAFGEPTEYRSQTLFVTTVNTRKIRAFSVLAKVLT